ncbi:DNA repair protein XRCC3-like protein [Zancudomyces culisetae]|uniref:DNA repair protein XRCC3-like protein n=1 Tax=Zancudomyces culisetae TaxID=1213189 RepID=A0A1R1PNA7_ZANCU|nr:DNA repair protein XRCC3-like protein [Zancudomyces culisetae]|eukprot:OMH82440.1 DNA repair protein XRCC3-like protein [Zancudomyces culisetae]
MIPSFARRFGFDFDTAEEIIERMTRRIHTKFILERDQFVFMVLYQLEKFISENNIKLVIIDSIAALFRYHSVLAIDEKDEFQKNLHRRECLSNIGNKLKELASKFDCAIVVVNQVSDYIPGAINTNNTVALPVNTDGHAAASTGSIKSSPPFHSTGHDSSFGNYDSSGINGAIAIFGDKIPALGKVWASCVNSRVFLKVKKSEIRVKGGYDLSEYAQHTTAAGNGVGLSNSFLSTGSFVSVGSSFDGSGRDPGRGSSRVMIGSKIPWSRPVCCSIRICSDGVFSC